jgi:hypothetical protein
MRLEPLPGSFAATREALHMVAERLVAPARKPDNEIALTATPGGFGTPPPITSLAAGGEPLAVELLGDGMPIDTDPLAVDPVAAERLGAFYAFAARVLELFRSGLPAAGDPSAINLWPEHFDIAFEGGSEASGLRANYGASPGDGDHPEPHLYIGP